MRAAALITIATSLALWHRSIAADGGKNDEEQLQGRWNATSTFDADGAVKTMAEDDPKHFTLSFEAGKLLTQFKKGTVERTYRLDPGKNPKQIDVVRRRGDRVFLFKGIYALEGDRLKVCLAGAGRERPKEFKAGHGIEFAVELRRVRE